MIHPAEVSLTWEEFRGKSTSDVLDRFEHFGNELRARLDESIANASWTNLDDPRLTLEVLAE